ncbi:MULTISPECIES: type II toxin-antitoxin system prevent-host-death family antitoxin [unclassified Mesorhizobium]|uniref:type II toxin-antitoxin system Phd/YefM family antitoxin n=1 Tax=unclassified Mesorhizobium TaxID=325217 RepID=UPI00112C0DFA|nr:MULTISPECIES: type II toxin-antitoxin system prevent-host-death family antitoxin [unclassified Mesorhizobium]TPK25726.1 type II toxin-antitoxin system prevent-host-death family antitoxin [Mesorhizobium sp. B2-5-6]MBZ9921768.1 type II toxin-antitoxin system prevent-host-death family antitoxin [Mesorhizobium sp. BR1-1-7]MBZ9952215.1 type II toxin-antitoxin system prevent-host-death family antitoxin [Mesorhizobium sp. BR1-1-15]MBZ9973011.1 type II toxin-antitoxin system prevent-host-death famil
MDDSTQIVNISDAKANPSRLVQRAANGEPFMIAKAGKSLVKVIPMDQSVPVQSRRVGFMAGQFSVSDRFDRMSGGEIEQLFGTDI